MTIMNTPLRQHLTVAIREIPDCFHQRIRTKEQLLHQAHLPQVPEETARTLQHINT